MPTIGKHFFVEQPKAHSWLKAKAKRALKKQATQTLKKQKLRKYLRNQYSKNIIKKKGLAGYYGRKRSLK